MYSKSPSTVNGHIYSRLAYCPYPVSTKCGVY